MIIAMTVILLLILFAGAIYHVCALLCVLDFFRCNKMSSPRISVETPVSIIKPLSGGDPDIAANVRTFCRQDYPEYEVLLGFSEQDRAAAAELEKDLEGGAIRVVVTSGYLGANRKVSNLQGLVDAARHPLLAVSDGDMKADSAYLKEIVSEYHAEPDTGMVACLYKIPRPGSLGEALESLTIALDFIPSVLVARQLEGITFGLGASMLISKKGLAEIGGLQAIADYLADDYQLGNRLWKQGYRIVISKVVLETVAGNISVGDFAAHQLRWARTYRVSRPLGFAGYGITFLFPFALFLLALQGPTALSLSVLSVVLLMRCIMAAVIHSRVIQSKQWLKWLPLLPIQDIAGFGIWLWSFAGSTVKWRGRRFRIVKGGKIVEEAERN